MRFVLVHGQERILPEVVPSLGSYAEEKLRSRGVEILLNTRSKAATAESVFLEGREPISTRPIVCTIGNAPTPLLKTLGCPTQRGRIVVDEATAVPAFAGVWSLGEGGRSTALSTLGEGELKGLAGTEFAGHGMGGPANRGSTHGSVLAARATGRICGHSVGIAPGGSSGREG